MELICYPRLYSCSRKAIKRRTTHWGRPYYYNPRGDLLVRLSQELNLTLTEVYEQLQKEREFLLLHQHYY